MRLDVRTNDALLKLDLYCQGAHVDDSVYDDRAGRPIIRTRAGLGSGLEVVIGAAMYTNVPVTEHFTKRSPYVFKRQGDGLWLFRQGEALRQVRLAPRPSWYERRTTSGKPMVRVGSLQGTYLGVYPTTVCEFWKGEKRNCHFCSVGLNLGADDADEKSLHDVAEVALTAAHESDVTYVDFNTGHYDGETYLDRALPYVERVKALTGNLVGLQTPPHSDLTRYRDLRRRGVNRVSFCFEIFDPDRFKEVCPGKHETYGLERYLEAIAWNARLGQESLDGFDQPWVTNGEIIAGLEPAASSIKAIDWITSVGAIPTVCVFRPLKGTDYEHLEPPRTEDVLPVFQRLYAATMARRLPIGIAPNVHVSLVMLPEECRELTPFRLRDAAGELRLGAMRRVFQRRFRAARAKVLARSAPIGEARP